MTAQTEKAQHTPGPWRVKPLLPRDGDRNYEYVMIEAAETPRYIAEIEYQENDPDFAIKDANARLIAAAPSLLEALREIAEADPNDFGSFELAEFQDKARAAIKEATGE